MTRFSANLGFLWTDRPLPDAIRAAKAAGFDAVECHWPYDTPASEVKRALVETGLPMLGLNTVRGDVGAGQMGLSALPGRRDDAVSAIEQAVSYADETGTKAVHVMAGISEGAEAEAIFIENLSVACDLAMRRRLTILIEPLNAFDAPGYFLRCTQQAKSLIEHVNAPNLKLMFDCYHVGRTEVDVPTTLNKMMPVIGHVQFAAVPDRGPPDHGDVDYRPIFSQIAGLGWDQPLGAEYKPGGDTDASLGWMVKFR
ncbi:Hydroxypyruvate isomerase [Rubripirellula lacrimiformis]|uniref:Hydroxypyruvate isomerase n=1 Tax=Rubripirellula lacrimiformis TaxID=1930273 RepID=A0A517N988_9BACT|nr:TIM barrel protein [Rubripirellula lacrimiformis]QDT03707.1 Hydroxypyruvate isomerase [Rubripirellula lacrimiformis]